MTNNPAAANPSSFRFSDVGWAESDPDTPELRARREYLIANNGITGLEMVEPTDIERAVQLFHRDGFVVVDHALNDEQTAFLRNGVHEVAREIVAADVGATGNRGAHRYSFGGSSATRSMLHRPEWQMLIDLPTVTPILIAIFGSADYIVRSGSGDFCLPGATEYQPLHSDMRDYADADSTPFSSFIDHRGHISVRDLPTPYVCVNFLPDDQTPLNGPTRQIPGSQHSRQPFPTLSDEPEWMRLSTVCPAPAGAVQIRDVRAWHGGTPNLSNELRAIPNMEFYAPWFREPLEPGISYADHQKLSDHGRKITQFVVADSSEDLPSGYSVKPLPQRSQLKE